MTSRLDIACAVVLVLAFTGCATSSSRPEEQPTTTPPTTDAPPQPTVASPRLAANDLARFVDWIQRAQLAYNLLLEATGDYQQIDAISTDVLRNKLPINVAEQQTRRHLAQYKAKLQRYEQASKQLAIPQVTSPELSAEMRQLTAYLGTLREQVKQGFAQSVALFNRVAQGQKVDTTQFAARRLEHYVAMLEAENAMMRASGMLSSADHPQHQLQKTVIASNLAVITILRGYLDKIEAHGTPPVLFIQEGQTNLNGARSAIDRGRKLATLAVVRLNGGGTQTFTPKVRNTLMNAMLTYKDSFQVEERIVGLIDASLNTLETGEQPTVLSAVEPLVQRRMQLQQQRQAMFRSIAEALR